MEIKGESPAGNYESQNTMKVYREQTRSLVRVDAITQIINEKGENYGIDPNPLKVLQPGEEINIKNSLTNEIHSMKIAFNFLGIEFKWDSKDKTKFWSEVKRREDKLKRERNIQD